jgi:hypothetical protein
MLIVYITPLRHQDIGELGMRSMRQPRGRVRTTLTPLLLSLRASSKDTQTDTRDPDARNIAFLLVKRKALRALFSYVDQTEQFKKLLETVSGNERNETIYD